MSLPTHDVDGTPVGTTKTIGGTVLTLRLSGVSTWTPTPQEIDAQYLEWREMSWGRDSAAVEATNQSNGHTS